MPPAVTPTDPPSTRRTLAGRLSRVTTSGRRIREVDGLRFVAIAAVVVQHLQQVVSDRHPAARWDAAAVTVRDWRFPVPLFFLISGFVLGLPFAGQRLLGEGPVSLRSYYWRRVTRLEPPYLLTLGLWYAVLVLYWRAPAGPLLPHLLASAGYVHNLVYRHGPSYMSTVNPVAWSLEVEVQFYLLAPLLTAAAFAPRRPWVRRGLMVAAAVGVNESHKVFRHWGIDLPVTAWDELPLFLMGFLLADVYLTTWRRSPPPARWADAVAVVAWAAIAVWFRDPAGVGRTLGPSVAFAPVLFVACWASLRGPWVSHALAWGPTMTVGGMCYSIYLLHQPLLRLLGQAAPLTTGRVGVDTALYTAAWGVPVMAASAVFFVWVERPCMRQDWPRRAWLWVRGDHYRRARTARQD